MKLTPEERQRVYEEEKARTEAQTRLRAEEQQRAFEQAAQQFGKNIHGCSAGCAVVFILIFLLSMMLSSGSKNDSSSNSSSSPVTTIGPHDGKTQEQVDKDQEDIRLLNEATKRIQNDPNYGQQA